MTKAIFLDPNRDGGYGVTVDRWHNNLEPGRTVLVIGDGCGGGRSAALKLDDLRMLRDRIDDVLAGGR